MTTTPAAQISLQRIERQVANIQIEGTAPLIVHAWSKKAREMMLAAQQGKKSPKTPKDPEQDFEDSRYQFADGSGDGFPTLGFKSATVTGAGRLFGKAVKMTELRLALSFLTDGVSTNNEQLTRLIYPDSSPLMREDMVRVGMGTADIRYRAEYPEWSAILRVEFVPNVIDLSSVVALVDAGGSNGVGEWRPEKDGTYGTYRVVGDVGPA